MAGRPSDRLAARILQIFCRRQGGVEALVLWGCVAKYVLWKAEEKLKAMGWRLPFGGQHDNDYVLRGMMWADNYGLFRENIEIRCPC